MAPELWEGKLVNLKVNYHPMCSHLLLLWQIMTCRIRILRLESTFPVPADFSCGRAGKRPLVHDSDVGLIPSNFREQYLTL